MQGQFYRMSLFAGIAVVIPDLTIVYVHERHAQELVPGKFEATTRNGFAGDRPDERDDIDGVSWGNGLLLLCETWRILPFLIPRVVNRRRTGGRLTEVLDADSARACPS
jgi:hypothetical protein